MKMKMLKAKCSGRFRTKIATDDGLCEFSDFEVVIPNHEREWHITHAMRMFPVYRENHPKYKDKPYFGIIKLRVDSVEEVEDDVLCLHKNIKDMNWVELQSLACYKKLRGIPLYKKGDIYNAREDAYREYEEKINGKRIFTSQKEIDDFRRKQEEKELTPAEISLLMSNSLNMVVDPERPDQSYSFSNLPDLFVDGKLERKPMTKGDDKQSATS